MWSQILSVELNFAAQVILLVRIVLSNAAHGAPDLLWRSTMLMWQTMYFFANSCKEACPNPVVNVKFALSTQIRLYGQLAIA